MQILLVEEDNISREVFSLMLSKTFDLTVLEDMGKAETAITSQHFDIIILDMQCNAFDGLSLCKSCASHTLSSPPIVIALGEDASEDKIRAVFEAGAYDYFVKPYNVAIFYESLMRLSNTINDYQTLEKNDQSARDTLGIALSQASFYGFAFDLLSEISHTKTIESLARTVLKGMSSRGIHCAIQITDTRDNVLTYEENTDVVGERTMQVFSVVKDQGRIFRFGKRLVFNDKHVSLFVKSMNDMSDVAYDSVLDIGARLIPSIEEQVFAISEHLLLLELQEDTKHIIKDLQFALSHQDEQSKKILQNVAGSISSSFDELELTESQEQFFLNLIESELESENNDVDFESIERSTQTVYDKIHELQNKAEEQSKNSSQFGDIDMF